MIWLASTTKNATTRYHKLFRDKTFFLIRFYFFKFLCDHLPSGAGRRQDIFNLHPVSERKVTTSVCIIGFRINENDPLRKI